MRRCGTDCATRRVVRVDVLGQFAGGSPIAAALERELADPKHERLRYLVAFARWPGLNLIDNALRAFAARPGVSIEGIVGIDLGGTTVEALTYLSELPRSVLRIVRSGRRDVVFHPKLFLFDGPDGWTAIVGSSNLTSGGLFTNAELCLRLRGRGTEANPFDGYWALFRTPLPPLTDDHVQVVDADLLAAIAPWLDVAAGRAPDRGKRDSGPALTPVALLAPPPPFKRSPRPPAPSSSVPASRRRVPSAVTSGGQAAGAFYVELWNETGGGTQVQFPKEAIEDFFAAAPGSITWVRLNTPGGPETHRIQTFPNSTFRIQLPFVRAAKRPAVLRFERVGQDTYSVGVRSRGQRGYTAWLRACTMRKTSKSKRYGFAP